MNILLKNSALAVLALTLAIPTAASTSTSAQAGSTRDAFVGGLVGGVVGGVIGSSHRRRVYREPVYVDRGNAHINWCYNRYRSYSARTNTYISYGGYAKRCFSPYS